MADFNNDGWLDLFICSYHDGRVRDIDSYIYWNRPGRGFSAADRTRLFTHSASGCVAADFNEDGWIDLAIAYHKVNGDHVGYSAMKEPKRFFNSQTFWWNGPDGFSEERVTKLPTAGPHGMTAVGPGNIMNRGSEEYYVSPPFKLPPGASAKKISWEAELPPKSWVRAQLRFANSKEGLEQATWMGPAGKGSWYDNHQQVEATDFAGKWIQYRLALGSRHSASSPRVKKVAVYYGIPRN